MKFSQKIFFGISILVFIGLNYISFFNVFQTDDYIYASQTRDLGFWGNCIDFYKNWGGRYFSYSLNALIPAGNPYFNWLPKALPIFYFLLLLFGFYLNFTFYFHQKQTQALRNAFILFLFYTVCLVDISEHYFWISGANIYLLPVVLSSFLIYFFGKYQSEKKIKIILFFLIILLMGTNEFIAIYLLLFMIFNYLSNKEKDRLHFLVIGILFFMASFLAPGNFNRMAGITDNFLVINTKRIGVFVANSGYVFLKISLLTPLFVKVFEEEIKLILNKVSIKKIKIAFSFSIVALLFSGILLLFNSGRVLELILFYTLLVCSVLLFYYFQNIKKLYLISFIVIILPSVHLISYKKENIMLNYNLNNIAQEISFTSLSKYEKEIHNRHKILKKTQDEEVFFKPIVTIPKVLYFEEIGTKENPNYINQQLKKFYKKKGVYLLEK